ncbi:hypothetical protein ENUP19_0315G0009 [Entamoeba nuttalli]|uniref:Cysteine protease n=1 Tax=Entamoeba nuttalli TaxID=412467 RepID=A0ABQ0DW58_9EUKA
MSMLRCIGYNIGSYFYNSMSSKRLIKLQPFTQKNVVHILGNCYYPETNENLNHLTFNDANLKIHDLIVATYRQKYSYLGNTYLSSDAGWGCAIRATQMMVVNALVIFKDQMQQIVDYNSFEHQQNKSQAKELIYDRISSLLSIHNIYIQQVIKTHNPKGTNFLPPSICCIAISSLLQEWDKKPFNCITCLDHIPTCSYPTLYLIPRIITFTEHQLILDSLALSQSRGFVGGIGESAIFVFGCQETTLFFLDPHYVQNAGDFGYFNPPTYQIDISLISQSVVFAFMCYEENECEQLRTIFNMGKIPIVPREFTSTKEIDGIEVLDF